MEQTCTIIRPDRPVWVRRYCVMQEYCFCLKSNNTTNTNVKCVMVLWQLLCVCHKKTLPDTLSPVRVFIIYKHNTYINLYVCYVVCVLYLSMTVAATTTTTQFRVDGKLSKHYTKYKWIQYAIALYTIHWTRIRRYKMWMNEVRKQGTRETIFILTVMATGFELRFKKWTIS